MNCHCLHKHINTQITNYDTIREHNKRRYLEDLQGHMVTNVKKTHIPKQKLILVDNIYDTPIRVMDRMWV